MSELHEFLVKIVQKDQIPTFLCGVFLGVTFVPLLLRLIKGWVNPYEKLIGELKSQVEQLADFKQSLEGEVKRLRTKVGNVERERDLLDEFSKVQEGQLGYLKEQAGHLSAECEEKATKLIDEREKFESEHRKLLQVRRTRNDLQKRVDVYDKQLDGVDNSDGKIWDKSAIGTAVPFVPLSLRRTAIISLVNLKGGVGKTTMTANLGAALAAQGLRVLLIDLDYQSSLTNLCLNNEEKIGLEQSNRHVDNFFEEGGDLTAFRRCVVRLQAPSGNGQLFLAPVHENFIDIENKLQARWHVGQIREDVRFRLRNALHCYQLRDSYDVVLIDCPPRWSTGSVNALAASDYVLIPVLLEKTSTEAVPRMLGWLKKFKMNCCQELNLLGVVGNKASNRKGLISREQLAWTDLQERSVSAWKDPVRLFDEIIREHPTFNGPFAALDPRHQPHYDTLIHLIRKEIPHAHLQPATVPPLAGAPSGGGGA